jgi:CNT family concentrative nucleoside transporter
MPRSAARRRRHLTPPMPPQLISLAGVIVFLGLAWLLSARKRLFPWRTVLWGLGLQFTFALLVLRTEAGKAFFSFTGAAIQKLIQFSNEGCKFVFGPLADGALLTEKLGPDNGFIFAVLVTGTIIIVSSLSTLFYHWGVLQRVVHAIAWVMRKAMRTSGSETLSAAANIFMGQTEAPLLIKPYVPRMTRSELLCMMIGGMGTIAGGVAAVYASLGEKQGHLDVAGFLLTASILNAPACLLMSKILLPETEVRETAGTDPRDPPRTTVNSIDALCRGAGDGMMLAINVLAMLIAFVAVVAMANFLFTAAQEQVGVTDPVTLQRLFGWLNAPFAWLMGVPAQDCVAVGQVLGERIVLNEFIGYLSLNQLTLEPRSYAIATFALCGFANFASIAIQVGGIGSLAPERRGEMAQLGFKAMLGGLLACYLSASVAGVLMAAP